MDAPGNDRNITIRIGNDRSVIAQTLFAAAYDGQPDVIAGFIQEGRRIDYTSPCGWSLAHFAAFGGQTEVLELLVSHGADTDVPDPLSRSPIYYAARKGHVDAIVLLHDNGALRNRFDCTAKTPAHAAYIEGHLDALQVLYDRGHGLPLFAGSDAETARPRPKPSRAVQPLFVEETLPRPKPSVFRRVKSWLKRRFKKSQSTGATRKSGDGRPQQTSRWSNCRPPHRKNTTSND